MPLRRSLRTEERSTPKIILLLTLITIVTSATSVVLTSFPQHLWLSNSTKFSDQVQFTGNNTAIIKGNQVSFNGGDIVPLSGRGFIRITAHQAQFGGGTYQEGIRTVFAEWNQNLLLQQQVGNFNLSQIAQIGIGNTVFNLIPISPDVLNVNVVDLTGKVASSTYNLQLVQSTTYLSENGVMLKLLKNSDNSISVSLIGSGYQNIWMRVI